MEAYKQALRLDPLCDEALYGTGMCLLALEKSFESLYFFNKALGINPDNELFLMGLAQAEYKIGNVISALDAYEKVSELDAGLIDLWLEWSFIYYEQGDFEKAHELISEGIAEIPDEAELYYRAVVYLISDGNYKEALGYLENALILDFDLHVLLFEFFPEKETQKALYKIIEQYRQK